MCGGDRGFLSGENQIPGAMGPPLRYFTNTPAPIPIRVNSSDIEAATWVTGKVVQKKKI